ALRRPRKGGGATAGGGPFGLSRDLGEITSRREVTTALLPQRLPPAAGRDADVRVCGIDRGRGATRLLRRAPFVPPVGAPCQKSSPPPWLGTRPPRRRVRTSSSDVGRSCRLGG